MAIDANGIKRTANVIQLNNVHFQNNLGKKLRFEKIDFSDAGIVYANPGTMYAWLNGGKTESASSSVSWKENDNTWYGGWMSYGKEINLQTLKNAGAKYIYVLGNHYKNRSNGGEPFSISSFAGVKGSAGAYSNIAGGDLEVNGFIINRIAEDQEKGTNGSFDAYISEIVVPVDYLISKEAVFCFFGCISEAIPTIQEWNYVNTAISEPIVYAVYEQ